MTAAAKLFHNYLHIDAGVTAGTYAQGTIFIFNNCHAYSYTLNGNQSIRCLRGKHGRHSIIICITHNCNG